MDRYSFSKKAVAVVLHQLFFVSMVTAFFTMDFFSDKENMRYASVYGSLGFLGLIIGFVLLAYLTRISGKGDSQEESALWKIDHIYLEIIVLGVVFLLYLLLRVVWKINLADFSLAGRLLVSATISYLFDTIFLLFYFSMVRRIKSGTIFRQTICYEIVVFLDKHVLKSKEEKQYIKDSLELESLILAVEEIAEGKEGVRLDEAQYHGQQELLAKAINRIGDGMKEAIAVSTKNERMKANLITNVSHDLKTPLTSIVNYVDLLKREELNNERAAHYIQIIDEKSQRLKQLTEDLVEASKISSGNIKLDMQRIDFVELLYQVGGEFDDRFEARGLTIVTKLPNESVMITADGRQLYRAIENLYTNAAKYALADTRVYVELSTENEYATFSIKNVAQKPFEMELTDGGNELAERFVRGESSRTTEGSGLGLSIARDLTHLMGATFEIKADLELFIVRIAFKMG